MAGLRADDVRSVVFGRPGWGKRGYSPVEVDGFLDRAATALEAVAAGRPAGLTVEDVQQVVFRKPPIGQRGYAEDAVDEFLDRLAESLPGAGGTTGIELNGAPLDR